MPLTRGGAGRHRAGCTASRWRGAPFREDGRHGAGCPSAFFPQPCLPRVPKVSAVPGAATTYFSAGLRGGCGRCSLVSAVCPPPAVAVGAWLALLADTLSARATPAAGPE